MAKRPSVQEILEAARRGTSIPAQGEPPAPAASAPPTPPASTQPTPTPGPDGPRPRLSLQEKLDKAEAERAARVAAREAGAAPAEATESGKPSIREKLELARAAHPIRDVAPREAESKAEEAEDAPPAPAAPSKAMSLKDKLAAARAGGPVAAKPDAPAETPAAPGPKKALSLAEKLAAARAGGAVAKEPPASTEAPASPDADAPKKALSLAEKLAAARGTAPKPSGPKAEAAAAADREPPSAEVAGTREVAEALRDAGARKAQEAAGRPSGPAPAGPRAPYSPESRPEPAAIETPPGSRLQLDRRGLLVFVSWTFIAWTALAAALAMLSWMMVRFLFPNAEAEPPSTVKVGRPLDYEPGEVSERFKDRWGFWVVRDVDDQGRDVIYALQTYCTHLGCPPTWLAGERKFKCPCHGSGFYKDGVNFEGPAPRPLERYKIGLADDGQIVVDKAQTFRKDLDQWSDPDSYLAV
ncbi:Rieske 2Fe-2S domain-containing protein [Paludisphaera sp.]|uniref:Rieske 2Fe-2S domain-containing protein n=1 Tax=Paludisphaera sp. TaxID=2017432 RepID=UPI00301C92CE